MSFESVRATIQTPIQVVGELIHVIKSNTIDYYKTNSLSEVTKLTRVEPITVVSRDCMNLEYTTDILSSCLNMFAGYYLQAIALNARIGSVRAVKILDKLNPDRDSSGFFASVESMSSIRVMLQDNYKYKLPRFTPAMEGKFKRMIDDDLTLDDLIDEEENAEKPEHGNLIGGRGTYDKIYPEAANLAVGKIFEVSIIIDDKQITVPVSIRLAPAVLPNSTVEHILTLKKEENTIIERYHAWRSGRIAFIRDLILCQDLIDTHKKALMNDEHGVYSEILRRANNAKKYGLITQNPSLATASNIFLISEESAANIERELGGKLTNPRVRQTAFENTYAMIIGIIDREWERVTFYHRGIGASTNVSIKDIKNGNKSKGADVADIMKTYLSGSAPSF